MHVRFEEKICFVREKTYFGAIVSSLNFISFARGTCIYIFINLLNFALKIMFFLTKLNGIVMFFFLNETKQRTTKKHRCKFNHSVAASIFFRLPKRNIEFFKKAFKIYEKKSSNAFFLSSFLGNFL